MSTITREFTKEQVMAHVLAKLDRHSKSTWPVSMASQAQMEKQILEIALASFEAEKGAEPVAFINGAWTLVYYRPPKELGLKIGDKLYTAPPAQMLEIENLEHFISFWKKVQAGQMKPGKNDIDHTVWFLEGLSNLTTPPAPVSVPDDVMAAIQKVARIRLDLNDFDGDKRGILDCLGDAEEALIEVVNRRAAMLQGADGNSPVIPDGWVACSERMPDKSQNVLISVNFDSPLIEPLICSARYTGSTFRRGDVTVKPGEGVEEVTHWMPLPAAPQQEVE